MIYSTIVFRIAPGHNADATAYLARIAQHITGLTGANYQRLTRLGGPAGQVALLASFNSLAEWDAARTKIAADPAWLKMADDAGKAGYFIAGSVETSIWQVS